MSITIRQVNEDDYAVIARIGRISVEESLRESCTAIVMQEFLAANYNDDTMRQELIAPANIYHIVYYNDEAAGFSKIVYNASHPNIQDSNTTKLDRIYLLSKFFDLKLGIRLLNFNIELSKAQEQSGMWLFTWKGNDRAINFYKKTGFSIIGDHDFKIAGDHYNPNYQMLLKY